MTSSAIKKCKLYTGNKICNSYNKGFDIQKASPKSTGHRVCYLKSNNKNYILTVSKETIKTKGDRVSHL